MVKRARGVRTAPDGDFIVAVQHFEMTEMIVFYGRF